MTLPVVGEVFDQPITNPYVALQHRPGLDRVRK